jgi:hypothetical protein
MSDNFKHEGSCLCGKVTITTENIDSKLGACHCGMCRKWSAGPFLTVDCGTAFKIEGQEHIKAYNSSEWAERAFCSNCGTSLYYKLKENNQHIFSSELFEGLDLKFDHQIFIDHKPKYYTFSNKTHEMTEAQVFAQYSATQE